MKLEWLFQRKRLFKGNDFSYRFQSKSTAKDFFTAEKIREGAECRREIVIKNQRNQRLFDLRKSAKKSGLKILPTAFKMSLTE